MNIGELKKLVSGGESERVEFKRSTGQRTEGARAVCGMLNGLGGFLLFGVSDKGKVVGHVRRTYLLPALEAGLVEMTVPDKPRSSKQKYRLTEKAEKLLAENSSTGQ